MPRTETMDAALQDIHERKEQLAEQAKIPEGRTHRHYRTVAAMFPKYNVDVRRVIMTARHGKLVLSFKQIAEILRNRFQLKNTRERDIDEIGVAGIYYTTVNQLERFNVSVEDFISGKQGDSLFPE